MAEGRFDWRLALSTGVAVVGLALMLLGATELAVVTREGGGRPVLGGLVFFVGVLLLALPVGLGLRDAIRHERRKRRQE